jgi:nitrogen-specific signal transduction histidine kinase/ActR/RegA family two-component response regulator
MASFQSIAGNPLPVECTMPLTFAPSKVNCHRATSLPGDPWLYASIRAVRQAGTPWIHLQLEARQKIAGRMRQLELEKQYLLTRLMRAEKKNGRMQIAQAQFNGLVASTGDHVFMLDGSGKYLFSNDRVRQFGIENGADLIGRRLQDVYPRDVAALYREKLQKVMHTNAAVSFSHQKTTSGEIEYHVDTLYPVHHDGAVWAVGGICSNVSEQKNIEKQLVQSQKMEAMGTLVAGVAHEINNPINLILFNLPLLEKMWRDLMPLLHEHIIKTPEKRIGGLPPVFVKQNLPRLISDMEMAANRVAQIVSGLKGFARKSNPAEKWDVQVNQAVLNAVRLADAAAKKLKILIEVNLASDLPLLRANLQNLEQVVLNLIINALESIGHDHGKVCIATRFIEPSQSIAIDVTDNGRGINPAVADNIFDPFVTDRQAAGGTGLGLSVTYNLVRAHQGDIRFRTKTGQGTTFSVVLPTVSARRPYKIMVVDDDTDFRGMIVRLLNRSTNCVIEDFANGAEALIRMGSHPPDLLILDMFMPEMDGLGVCRAVKNELGLELMKVIIVTGFPDHPNLFEAAGMGFSQILSKPLVVDEFINMVKENLDGKFSNQFSHSGR